MLTHMSLYIQLRSYPNCYFEVISRAGLLPYPTGLQKGNAGLPSPGPHTQGALTSSLLPPDLHRGHTELGCGVIVHTTEGPAGVENPGLNWPNAQRHVVHLCSVYVFVCCACNVCVCSVLDCVEGALFMLNMHACVLECAQMCVRVCDLVRSQSGVGRAGARACYGMLLAHMAGTNLV